MTSYRRGRIPSSMNFPTPLQWLMRGFLFQYLSHIPPHWAALNLFASWWLEWVHYPVTSFTEVFSPKVLERQHFYMFASSINSPKWTEGTHTWPDLMLLTIGTATQSGTNLELMCRLFPSSHCEGSTNTEGKFKGNWEKEGKPNQTLSVFSLLTPCDLKKKKNQKLLCEKQQLLAPTCVCLGMLAIMWLLKP